MNLKRIIREELSALSDSFYLLVSGDEKFIYGTGKFGGDSFEPVENFDAEAILRSRFRTEDDALEKISWAEYYKGKRNELGEIADDMLKHNPKVVPVDFILRKRDESFPIIESDDLDWIRDQNPPILKSLTNVTIDNDNINVTWDNGNFENIEDVNGHDYFTEDDLGEFLGCENDMWDESIKNITKEKLLLFLKDNIEGSWTFDKCEKGWKDKTGGGVEDCLDFMKLYRLIEKI
tara:strand:- start:350 stop:1051 length:702 start_codon:yes stop_codon:yes gene_type:complete